MLYRPPEQAFPSPSPIACMMPAFNVAELNFDTCVSLSFFSKTRDPLVAKTANTQVKDTNFGFLIAKLT